MDFTAEQLKCIEDHRHYNVEGVDWWDIEVDQLVSDLRAFGFDVRTRGKHNPPEVWFSGFWSQGDGASFALQTSSYAEVAMRGRKTLLEDKDPDYVDTQDPVRKAIIAAWEYVERGVMTMQLAGFGDAADDLSFRVHTDGRYSHSGTMSVEWEFYTEVPAEIHDPATCDLEQLLRDVADQFYSSLEREYDYLTSDEAVWEAIESNDLFNPEEEDGQEAA